ncbi:MAG: rhodanese-like domain-containing protein [Candidatus Krumholzibacteriota bacterium]
MHKRLTWMLLMLMALLVFVGCSDDDDPAAPPAATNFETIAEAVEAYLPVVGTSYIKAVDLNPMVNADPPTTVVFDIRNADYYASGHIKGAISTTLADIVTAVEAEGLAKTDHLVIACDTGQVAGHAVLALRLLGYENAKTLKFGMSSWNDKGTGPRWTEPVAPATTSGSCKDDLAPTNIEVTENALGDDDLQDYPTGQKTLRDAVLDMLAAGFQKTTMGDVNLAGNMDTYFWLNYVPMDDYTDQGVTPGHVKGAYQFSPNGSNDIDRNLKMKYLPTDGTTILVYCYTGQGSSQAVAALNVLGYKAKSVKFGYNHLFYNNVGYTAGSKWKDTMCGDYPLYNNDGILIP